MRSSAADESAVERVLSMLMLAAFWSAFLCLAAGLALWVRNHGSDAGALLLVGGLLGLLVMPLLRLVAALIASIRDRDWLTLTATLTVLVILFALTLRDAAGAK